MIEPGEFLAIVARAELRTASGDWAEAAALWAQVTAENPVNGDYWASLAEARFAGHEYTAARQAYEKVRELGVQGGHQQQYREDLPELLPGEVAYRIACCLAALGRETSAIFVGEPTGSRPNFIGETIYFELPYSKVRANAADLFWQTSWPDDYRTWIAPDIYVPPAFEAFSRNEDPAMNAILALREHFPGC